LCRFVLSPNLPWSTSLYSQTSYCRFQSDYD
jgi:hypothetical protein